MSVRPPGLIPFDGRVVDEALPVRVHRTFGDSPGLWTITQAGEVVAHADYVALRDVRFLVDDEARRRSWGSTDGGRVVFAWAEGLLTEGGGDLPCPVVFDGQAGVFRCGPARSPPNAPRIDAARQAAFRQRLVTVEGPR